MARTSTLLIKAGVDAGLDIRYDSYLAHVIGARHRDRRRPAKAG